MPATPDRSNEHPFSRLIRDGRARKGWTLDQLINESGVSRSTVLRFEGYKVGEQTRPEPENVRKVFGALGIPFIEAVIALGYMTREEANLPPEPPRMFDASVEEVIEILQDSKVSDAEKFEWVEYLKFRTRRDAESARSRRRRAG